MKSEVVHVQLMLLDTWCPDSHCEHHIPVSQEQYFLLSVGVKEVHDTVLTVKYMVFSFLQAALA